MDMALVKNANRMMTTAKLLEEGIELSFADGLKGLIPYAELPEVPSRAGISGLELPNPYEMVLKLAGGESVEIPWDFARHYCDPSYRPTIEAIAALGRQTIGQKGSAFQRIGRSDPGSACTGCGHRAGYVGEIGERGTVPPVQDPAGNCVRPGQRHPGFSGGTVAWARLVNR